LDFIADKHYYYCIEDTSFYDLMMSIGHKHGWDILKSPLQTIFARCSSSNVEKYFAFLKMIASKKLGVKDLCQNLLSIIVKSLTDEPDATANDSPTPYSSNYKGYESCIVYRSKNFVTQLFSLLSAVKSNDLFASAVSVLYSKPVYYPVLQTLGPAVVDFCKSIKVERNGPLQEIITYCTLQLELSIQEVTVAPTNSAKPVKFTCSCKDCVELICFMKHPTETQHRFKIGLSRRQHLHQQLDSTRADVIHKTEQIGSPHTLVITKTNASYESSVKKHQQERALLASLQPLLSVKDVSSVEVEPPAKRQKAAGNSHSTVSSTQNVSSQSYIDLT